MHKVLGEIAEFVGGSVIGDERLVITGVHGVQDAQDGDLTFVDNPKYFSLIGKTQASAIIVPAGMKDAAPDNKSLIVADNPSYAFARAASLFIEDEDFFPKGIHESALIAGSARVGKDARIGPFVVVEDEVRIGDRVMIGAGSFIGAKTRVGSGTRIYPHVTIREKGAIGERATIHSGAVIGADGFGFVNVEGEHKKIPQFGIVVIEDDVEIGANVTIDRARFGETFVGRGTKIDNLVHIAHNVKIGKNCLIIALVGISGSVTLGENVILAGQAGITGHLSIGDGSIVMAKAGVTKSLPAGSTVFGWPAQSHKVAKRLRAHVQRLPDYVKQIRELKERIEKLEENRAKEGSQ